MPLVQSLSDKLHLLFTEPEATAKQFHISSWLFVRLLALIYLVAFLSLSVQITGLVGDQGILPLGQYLETVQQSLGNTAWFRLPTLFWIDHSDTSLLMACYAGVLFSALLFIGKYQLISSIGLFILYLSVWKAGQLFLNFQWDYLLLEAGFITIFLVQGHNRVSIFLFHWLLFRLRFLSGLSKTDDASWTNLTTLNYYFETQPLPHLGSWYFHQLPDWLLRTGTGFTLFVELVVPFFIFLPRPWRLFAAFSTILLQLLIIASSNHNWVNLLTIILCLFLLDDRLMSSLVPSFVKGRGMNRQQGRSRVSRGITAFFAAVILSTSVATIAHMLTGAGLPEPFRWVRGYGLGNVYHIFPTMQIERYEFQIEGSHDGRIWRQYIFKYKPNNLSDMPAFIVPHQPRLDWMIWFVPSKQPDQRYWFERFLWGLKTNEAVITDLLEHNPFSDRPPGFIRVLTYRYRFTNTDEFAETGEYWKADYLGLFPFVPARRP